MRCSSTAGCPGPACGPAPQLGAFPRAAPEDRGGRARPRPSGPLRYLPALVKAGLDVPVHRRAGTAALAEVVLRRGAHLAEEDARDAREGGWSRHDWPLPLYAAADAELTIKLLTPVERDVETPLPGGMTLRLPNAGRGSASPVISMSPVPGARGPSGGGGQTIVFSGDLGRATHSFLRPPQPPPDADAIVVESTYGDRRHPDPDADRLAAVLRGTIERGGVVLIPAFAVDRTEVVLSALRRLMLFGAGSTPPARRASSSRPPGWPAAGASCTTWPRCCRTGGRRSRSSAIKPRAPAAGHWPRARPR